ncbi:MAG TPA: Uma2 family endonuclease [Candidatus Elarobacter sp.]|jgi:Uma2 family endonuclease|nr:Uma2 family endonuclease [Candidatus Elarobacter sp.]
MQARKDDKRPNLRPITVAEYHRMGESGYFAPEERVELLDGELIAMPPMSPEHAASVSALDRFFQRRVGEQAWISPQGAITLDPISEPQPDIIIGVVGDDKYWTAHPTPDDALLVVEVPKSTLAFDRGKKLRAYARCRVREYWIVDLVHERVEVYRKPRGQRYTKHQTVERGGTVAPDTFPDAVLAVDEILPPRTPGM